MTPLQASSASRKPSDHARPHDAPTRTRLVTLPDKGNEA